MKAWLARWRDAAERLEREVHAVYLAWRHPRTPWYAKLAAAAVAVYAFSPIDLIPDFIPVLGYLDDLILLPLGVYLVLKLVPQEVMAECRTRAEREAGQENPALKAGSLLILLLWVVGAATVAWLLWQRYAPAV